MAEGRIPSKDNLSIVVMNTDFGEIEKNDKNFYNRRNAEIVSFFKELNPKPDFLLLQEVKITHREKNGNKTKYDQADAISGALGNDVYSAVKMQESDYRINKPERTSIKRVITYNKILHKKEYAVTEIASDSKRYCAAKFTFQKREILLISLHANF